MEQEYRIKETQNQTSYQRENELLEKVWKRVAPDQQVDHSVYDTITLPSNKPVTWEKEIISFLTDEYADFQYYRRMAQRYKAHSIELSAIGTEELRHAKRLAVVLFLRAGIRIPPSQVRRTARIPDYYSALRIRILAEQKGESAYRKASENAPDEALKQLYRELAEEEQKHAQILQTLLEKTI